MHQLPGDVVRLTRFPRGIELYFPPLRNAGAALALAFFGVASFTPGFFAAVAVAALSDSGPAGMLSIWLMSIFILPFVAFGVLFLVLAFYQVANSLAVSVTDSEIRSLRRVLGVPLRERRIATADIAALDTLTVVRHRRPREDATYYSLVVRRKNGGGSTMAEAHRLGRIAQFRNRRLTVAESLRGQVMMEEVKAEIIKAGRLEHLLEKRDE